MSDDIPYHLLVVILVALMFLLMAIQDRFFPLGNMETKNDYAVASAYNKIPGFINPPIPAG